MWKKKVYISDSAQPFRLNRTKIDLFFDCERCFVLDQKFGIKRPFGTPLVMNNKIVNTLKDELEICREKKQIHPQVLENNLNYIPNNFELLNDWKNPFKGVKYTHKKTNFLLNGTIDDVWINKETNKLIVVDYKSQSSEREITTNNYLNGIFKQGYKMQMDFYVYLLREMGFDVHPDAYFVVCNGDRTVADFNGLMKFDEYLIPYEWNTEWIHNEVINMIDCMNSNSLPESNKSCKNCAYAAQRAIKEL